MFDDDFVCFSVYKNINITGMTDGLE